ncbi:sensor histidine kinase [Leucobacter sp. OH1287]|uniref:sensor histidine kinase n=1 Tax=Leucobacter sp. OH1287 TaxID=2491049 RepID=UPI000F5F5147|nr:sensor histidine kinase [Leucobacter sp. OH1287]RRD61167.1 sensor histidine kinase [Leucobacter sp. OH1287]
MTVALSRSASRPLELSILAGALALMALPSALAFAEADPGRTRILTFSLLSAAQLLIGSYWLSRSGVSLLSPATRINWRVVLHLIVFSSLWAVVIADSPYASYLLFVLVLKSYWLLPPLPGFIAATLLTAGTIGGELMHHSWSPFTVLGPLIAFAIISVFSALLRSLLAANNAKSRALAELTAAREQLAETERRAGVLAERSRIAAELHDTVAQSLSSIQLFLQMAANKPESSAKHIELARAAAAHSLAETRSFITELKAPADLRGNSLPTALRQVVDRAAQHSIARAAESPAAGSPTAKPVTTAFSLRCELGGSTLPLAHETTLLRICQASIENVVQHAGAAHCEVRLSASDNEVRLEIDDDGVGFDYDQQLVSAVQSDSGWGLKLLADRVQILGGNLAVVTEPGAGCLTSVTLPLKNNQTGETP